MVKTIYFSNMMLFKKKNYLTIHGIKIRSRGAQAPSPCSGFALEFHILVRAYSERLFINYVLRQVCIFTVSFAVDYSNKLCFKRLSIFSHSFSKHRVINIFQATYLKVKRVKTTVLINFEQTAIRGALPSSVVVSVPTNDEP